MCSLDVILYRVCYLNCMGSLRSKDLLSARLLPSGGGTGAAQHRRLRGITARPSEGGARSSSTGPTRFMVEKPVV